MNDKQCGSYKNIEVNLTKGTSEWEGWGTALKPALEPITVARKPLSEKTVAENVLKWGTGGINIDGCRVGLADGDDTKRTSGGHKTSYIGGHIEKNYGIENQADRDMGRFPANLIHDGSDEVVSLFPNTGQPCGSVKKTTHKDGMFGIGQPGMIFTEQDGDNRSASRFFYCAKASKSERNRGCEELEDLDPHTTYANDEWSRNNMGNTPTVKRKPVKNNHPTVKPIALMEYLIKLVSKEGATILDCFMGSGTTGIACNNLGRQFIGIEMNAEYFEIAKARIENQDMMLC
jgi:hypothetical protein